LPTIAEPPQPGAPPPSPRRRPAWPLAVGITLSLLLLWLAVRGLQFEEVLHHVRQVRPLPLLACVALATLTFPLRALRWRLLLADPTGTPIPLGPAWHAVAIGFMGNNVLPLRAGELMRAYAAGRLAPVRTSSALASIAVERVFDALTVVTMLAVALLTAGFAEDLRIGTLSLPTLARRVGLVTALAALAAAVVLTRPLATERLIRRMVPLPGIAQRLVALLEGIRQGLAALRSPARLGAVALWSLVLWTVNALSFAALFPAFGLAVGLGGAFVVQGAVVFGVALPSSPGYVGVFEAAVMLALALYGVSQEQAFAYAVTYHATTFLPIILLGLYSLARTPLAWRTIRESTT
jgi:uncharacterized protein (TIRG00374 family)